MSAGHAAPPCWAVVVTERVVALEPAPQELEQASEAAQPLTTQSMGHACWLQAWVSESVKGVHETPPLAPATTMERLWLLVPRAPQVYEQVPQADQVESWQSAGQRWLLQGSFLLRLPQGLPPHAAP